MIKGLIITHGKLGAELIRVVEHIFNKSKEELGLTSLRFDWSDDGSIIDNQIKEFIDSNKDSNIIIFTDMFGGSPSNIASNYLNNNLDVITGVNLPAIFKFVSYKDKPMDFHKIVNYIKKGSIDGINVLSKYLGEREND